MSKDITLSQADVAAMLKALTQMSDILSAASIVVDEPAPEPEPEPAPIVPPIVAPTPTPVVDTAAFEHNGIKFYKHESLSMAKDGFKTTYGTGPADNDNVDGIWYSASANFGATDLPNGISAPSEPAPASGEGSGSGVITTGTISGSANMQKSSGGMYAGTHDGHSSFNSTHHERLNTFQKSDGKWYQRWAYYADNKRCAIVEREFPNGKWDKPVDCHDIVNIGGKGDSNWNWPTTNGIPNVDFDNHNSLSTNTTAGGRAIVCGNQHASNIHIAVSDTDDLNGKWTSFDYKDFPTQEGIQHSRDTYPALTSFNGDVILSVRMQKSGGGVANAPWTWSFTKFNESTNKWEDMSAIQFAKGARCYMSNPSVFTMENGKQRIGITGLFRDEVEGGGNAHYDLIHYYSDDGKNWRQFNLKDGGSVAIKTPVTFDIKSNKSNAPVKIWDTAGRGDPKQSSYVTGWTADGHPTVYVNSRGTFNGGRHHIYTHGDKGWTVATEAGAFKNDPDTCRFFGLPNGDTGLVWGCGSDIRFQNLNSKAGSNYSSGRVLAKSVINGNYNMIIDERARMLGWLSMQVFRGGVGNSEPGYTISIPLDEVEGLKTPFVK